jgi:hypothetical protein
MTGNGQKISPGTFALTGPEVNIVTYNAQDTPHQAPEASGQPAAPAVPDHREKRKWYATLWQTKGGFLYANHNPHRR